MRESKLQVRGLQTHVQEWGDSSQPTLFLLHGWMDCGATFKYLMPELSDHFHVIAPDLRGFGQTDHAPGGYWFPDYFADLEVILDHYAPLGKVNLAGHSMGGNIVLMYAGIRPDRVGKVLSLEGLGLPPTQPDESIGKYQQWMQQILSDEPARIYPSATMLKQSIYKGNPTLPDHVIEDLAELWGKPVGDDGAMTLRHDHRHRYTNPVRYVFDDVEQIWRNVQATVGLVMATDSGMFRRFGPRIGEVRELLRISPNHYYEITECNHMLHMEQPQATTAHMVDFFS